MKVEMRGADTTLVELTLEVLLDAALGSYFELQFIGGFTGSWRKDSNRWWVFDTTQSFQTPSELIQKALHATGKTPILHLSIDEGEE